MSTLLPGSRSLWICAFLVVLALARIVATYPVLTHTMDEPTHISCGLEWWQENKYSYETLHPPLGRVAAAFGPYLLGSKNVSAQESSSKSPLLLYEAPSYWTMLSAARAGELPFFLLAVLVVWAWARHLHGDRTAICSVFLFTALPPVLAHAGLATTDIALCATVPAVFYTLYRWLESPTIKRGVLLGIATAAAMLSKYTALIFLPAGCVAILALYPKRPELLNKHRALSLLVSAGVAFAILWGGYCFSVAEVPLVKGVYMLPLPEQVKEAALDYPGVHLPAGEYLRGMLEAQYYNQHGQQSYLLGEQSERGWWYFFPVVFSIKTPLPYLLLALLGCVWLFRCPREQWLPAACAVAIFAVVLPARINLGIRHILPIFPLLSIPAGFAIARMIAGAPRGMPVAAVLLASWSTWSSFSAHPDYIGYFNEIAAGAPEQYRVDSDLDWGQNLKRLSDWVDAKGIQDPIAFAWYGSSDPSRHDIMFVPASPWHAPTGWAAISTTPLMMGSNSQDRFGRRAWWWLDGRTPDETIGGILLFYISGNSANTRHFGNTR
jgi:hypothetical protein